MRSGLNSRRRNPAASACRIPSPARDADFLGGAGIDGRFEDHDGAALEVAAGGFGGADQQA
jgi:hypothetical protein